MREFVNGPASWKITCDILEAKFGKGNVLIAGGCVRDSYFGVEPKDVDIFLNIKNPLDFELEMETLEHTFFEVFPEEEYSWNIGNIYQEFERYGLPSSNTEPLKSSKQREITFLFNMIGNDIPLQFIGINLPDKKFTPENLVKTFDYNWVQMWWDNSIEEIKCFPSLPNELKKKKLVIFDEEDEERYKRTIQRIISFLERNKRNKTLKDVILPKRKSSPSLSIREMLKF